jgi:hypothetical protein
MGWSWCWNTGSDKGEKGGEKSYKHPTKLTRNLVLNATRLIILGNLSVVGFVFLFFFAQIPRERDRDREGEKLRCSTYPDAAARLHRRYSLDNESQARSQQGPAHTPLSLCEHLTKGWWRLTR